MAVASPSYHHSIPPLSFHCSLAGQERLVASLIAGLAFVTEQTVALVAGLAFVAKLAIS